jgi:hypothetical protein
MSNSQRTSGRRAPERRVPLFEKLPVRPVPFEAREADRLLVEPLQPVDEHRAVGFVQHVVAHLDASRHTAQ